MPLKSKKDLNKKQSVPRVSNLYGNRWCGDVFCRAWIGTCPILDKLKSLFQGDEITIAAVAYETGENGIHPHWQFYFQTAQMCRMKAKFTSLLGEASGFHLQLAKGTLNANLSYIWAVKKDHQLGWVHYSKNCEPPSGYKPWKTNNLVWFHHNMKPWQMQIVAKLMKIPDYRDIFWIYEPKGNTGKTYLAKYLHYFHGAIITGGKSEDMKYAISRWKQITGHYPVIIIIDLGRASSIPRSAYYTLEQIKNAMFFAGKYQSGMVASCVPPHVLILANQPPDTRHMSRDRWVIKRIDQNTDQFVDQTDQHLSKNAW